MAKSLRALIIEDSETDCALLVRTLERGGFDVKHSRVDSEAALRSCLQSDSWDIVISDYSMPGFSGTSALAIVRECGLDIPFIFFSGTIGEEIAVNSMKVGAQDYILKNNVARLLPAVERELREAGNRRERRRVEQRMRQLEKFEVIGKLAGGIAHDFNNVLGAIMGWSELGLQEVTDGTGAARYLEKIRVQSQRAAGLTRQLLAYARRQVLEPRNINLNEIVRESIVLLEKAIGAQISVKLTLDSDLQPTRADPSQIEQVFMNLCLNARDAMPQGGQLLIETRNVDLDETYCAKHTYSLPGRYVRLSVSDTGTGMDAATMDRIFEPFFTTKEVGKGTGLGLATALGVVKQHDGSIEVYSEPGKGTVFQVFLPASLGAVESVQQTGEACVRGGAETILIADDHEGIREMAQEVLQSMGYRVITSQDGEEAVRKFEAGRESIALVLLDVVMPKLNGPEAAQMISLLKPGVPVILTSGYTEQGVVTGSTLPKDTVFLQKPYGPKGLARKVRELLDRA